MINTSSNGIILIDEIEQGLGLIEFSIWSKH